MPDDSNRKLSKVACGLLLVAIPCGVAAQSLAILVTTALSLKIYFGTEKSIRHPWILNKWHQMSLWAFCAFIFFQVLATILNPENPDQNLIKHSIGFLTVVVFPMIISHSWNLQAMTKQKWLDWTTFLLVVLCFVTISQAVWGWKLSGYKMVFSEHFHRARGFYSHPLTLAYVLLMIWPFVFIQALNNWQKLQSWINITSMVIMFYLSSSRTVMVCAALSVLFSIWAMFKGRTRALIILSLLVLAGGSAFTDNPLSQRYRMLFSDKNSDRFSTYPDDRFAFWAAFYEMVKERPLLGHGIHLNEQYRTPYYQAIGLGDFKKKYTAHNQFLQITAEGGILGLLSFLAWLFLIYRSFAEFDPTKKLILQQTLLVFILGGLTQNAFQDSEVRYTITFLLGLAIVIRYHMGKTKEETVS